MYKRRVHAKWRGLYDDVPKQALRVALVERGRFGGTGELDAVLADLKEDVAKRRLALQLCHLLLEFS